MFIWGFYWMSSKMGMIGQVDDRWQAKNPRQQYWVHTDFCVGRKLGINLHVKIFGMDENLSSD